MKNRYSWKRIGFRAFTPLAVAGLLVAIGATVANASTPPPNATAQQLLSPAITMGNTSYYTDAQVQAAWVAVTSHFERPLPPGVTFPDKPVGILSVHDGKKHLFDAALPDMMAAQYWRCAWLQKAISDSASAKVSTQKSDGSELGHYSTLPSVASHLDISRLNKAVASAANRSGQSDYQAEFNMQCPGIYGGGGE